MKCQICGKRVAKNVISTEIGRIPALLGCDSCAIQAGLYGYAVEIALEIDTSSKNFTSKGFSKGMNIYDRILGKVSYHKYILSFPGLKNLGE